MIFVVGYAVMHWLVLASPTGANNIFIAIGLMLAIIAIGLVVPYLMLKSGFHAAHLQNPQEKELELKDLPKDADDIAPSQGSDASRIK